MEVLYLRIKVLHICKTYFEIREKRSTRFFLKIWWISLGIRMNPVRNSHSLKNKLPHVNAAASASLFISE